MDRVSQHRDKWCQEKARMSSAVFIQNVARNLVDREVASSGRG